MCKSADMCTVHEVCAVCIFRVCVHTHSWIVLTCVKGVIVSFCRFLETGLHNASLASDEEYQTLGSYDNELSLMRTQVAKMVTAFLSDQVTGLCISCSNTMMFNTVVCDNVMCDSVMCDNVMCDSVM